jgi:hypothetical protein
MTPQDRNKFAQLMQALGAGFAKPVNADMIETYFEALRDRYIEQVEQAVKMHLRYRKTFPKPSELRPSEDQDVDTENKLTVKTWEELRQRDPARYWVEFERAYLARLDFRLPPGSAEHKQAADRCRDRCAAELRQLSAPVGHSGADRDDF